MKTAQIRNSELLCWVMCFKADVLLVPLQIPSGNLGMFGNSGAAQARTMQQPQQPPVQPLNSSQPSLRAQVPQFLSPQVRWSFQSEVFPFPGIPPCFLILWWSWGSAAIKHVVWWSVLPCVLSVCADSLTPFCSVPRKLSTLFSFFLFHFL